MITITIKLKWDSLLKSHGIFRLFGYKENHFPNIKQFFRNNKKCFFFILIETCQFIQFLIQNYKQPLLEKKKRTFPFTIQFLFQCWTWNCLNLKLWKQKQKLHSFKYDVKSSTIAAIEYNTESSKKNNNNNHWNTFWHIFWRL